MFSLVLPSGPPRRRIEHHPELVAELKRRHGLP
jgi:hypothetical protein